MKNKRKMLMSLLIVGAFLISQKVNALSIGGGGSITIKPLEYSFEVSYVDKNGDLIDSTLDYVGRQTGVGKTFDLEVKSIPNYTFEGYYYTDLLNVNNGGSATNLLLTNPPTITTLADGSDFGNLAGTPIEDADTCTNGDEVKDPQATCFWGLYSVKMVYKSSNVVETYTVRYNTNGGSGTAIDDASPYNSGEEATILAASTVSKFGHRLVEWNTESDGTGTGYNPGDKVIVTSNIVLFAKWAALEKFTITYDANTGTGTVIDTVQYFENTNGQIKEGTALSKTGYTFAGWNTKADGTGTAYAAKSIITVNGNITLYAQWTEDAAAIQKYTVTYDANTGTGTVTDVTQYDENTNATVKDITGITKTGYTFTEWNTKADGTGTAYAANATLLMDANKTLYAQWTEDAVVTQKYTVTYDANTGTGTTTDVTQYDENTNAVVKDITGITKTGYTFTEWNTKADGTGTAYAPNSVLLMDANKTLYAQWTEDAVATQKYTVTYDSNTGIGTVTDATQYDENTNAVVKDITGITKTGYTFSGWNTKADGTGTAYAANATLLMDANKTLYAQWTEDATATQKYTVTYDANTGTGTITDATQYDENTNATVKDITGITKTGYTFSGWNTKADGTGTAYAANATLLMDANKTLYAQWTINTYTIDYNKNGGNGELKDTTTSKPGEPTTVKGIEGVTNPGNKFVGWNTEPDGSGTSYKPGEKVTLTGNIKLYAQWELIDGENKVVDPNNKISGNNALPNTGNDIMSNVVMLVLASAITLTTRRIYSK